MPFIAKGVNITKVVCNGVNVNNIVCNGATVFKAEATIFKVNSSGGVIVNDTNYITIPSVRYAYGQQDKGWYANSGTWYLKNLSSFKKITIKLYASKYNYGVPKLATNLSTYNLSTSGDTYIYNVPGVSYTPNTEITLDTANLSSLLLTGSTPGGGYDCFNCTITEIILHN